MVERPWFDEAVVPLRGEWPCSAFLAQKRPEVEDFFAPPGELFPVLGSSRAQKNVWTTSSVRAIFSIMYTRYSRMSWYKAWCAGSRIWLDCSLIEASLGHVFSLIDRSGDYLVD